MPASPVHRVQGLGSCSWRRGETRLLIEREGVRRGCREAKVPTRGCWGARLQNCQSRSARSWRGSIRRTGGQDQRAGTPFVAVPRGRHPLGGVRESHSCRTQTRRVWISAPFGILSACSFGGTGHKTCGSWILQNKRSVTQNAVAFHTENATGGGLNGTTAKIRKGEAARKKKGARRANSGRADRTGRR